MLSFRDIVTKINPMNTFLIFIGIGLFILCVFYFLIGIIIAMAMTTSGETTDPFFQVFIKWPWYLKSEDREDIPIL
jgi:hypothetical protein